MVFVISIISLLEMGDTNKVLNILPNRWMRPKHGFTGVEGFVDTTMLRRKKHVMGRLLFGLWLLGSFGFMRLMTKARILQN